MQESDFSKHSDNLAVKKGKRVKWGTNALEEVKFFKITDLPNYPGLNVKQVEEI